MESINVVKDKIESKLNSMGYSLYSFKIINGKEKILEIIIDREEPIDLDSISLVSEEINNLLDNNDFINESYLLDISSLGVEKPIDICNFKKYTNKYINIHLLNPYEGESYIEGYLTNVEENYITLQYFKKGRKVNINFEKNNIDKARLAIKF